MTTAKTVSPDRAKSAPKNALALLKVYPDVKNALLAQAARTEGETS